MTCIVCPICKLTDSGEISGHRCPGAGIGRAELDNPVRMLTTTVAQTEELELLPVRTQTPVPKAKLMDCLSHAKRLRVSPSKMGQVICPTWREGG